MSEKPFQKISLLPGSIVTIKAKAALNVYVEQGPSIDQIILPCVSIETIQKSFSEWKNNLMEVITNE